MVVNIDSENVRNMRDEISDHQTLKDCLLYKIVRQVALDGRPERLIKKFSPTLDRKFLSIRMELAYKGFALLQSPLPKTLDWKGAMDLYSAELYRRSLTSRRR